MNNFDIKKYYKKTKIHLQEKSRSNDDLEKSSSLYPIPK